MNEIKVEQKYQLVRKIDAQDWEAVGTPLSKQDLELLVEVEFHKNLVPSGSRYHKDYPSFIGLMPGLSGKAQSLEVSWFEV